MSTAVLALRMVLAAVFVAAGVGKLLDLQGSRQAARDFGVPDSLAPAAGLLLPLAELGIAAGLVLRPSAGWAAGGALLLLLAFIAAIAGAMRRGEAPDCHCFGQIHSEPVGRGTLIRNAVLAGMAALVVAQAPGAALDAWVAARTAAELVAVGMGICAAVLGLVSLRLWLDGRRLRRELGLVTKIAMLVPPGLPVGDPAPDFALAGLAEETVTLESLREPGLPVLLLFVSPACDSCAELFPDVRRWQRTLAERLTIVLVSTGNAQENRTVFEQHSLANVLLQKRFEVGEEYRVRATPSALIVTPWGTVGSIVTEAAFRIEPMIRLVLRDGVEAPPAIVPSPA